MPTANEPITHRESALWADMRRVQGDELFYAYMDNQAIVIPEPSMPSVRWPEQSKPRASRS